MYILFSISIYQLKWFGSLTANGLRTNKYKIRKLLPTQKAQSNLPIHTYIHKLIQFVRRNDNLQNLQIVLRSSTSSIYTSYHSCRAQHTEIIFENIQSYSQQLQQKSVVIRPPHKNESNEQTKKSNQPIS